MWLTAHGRGGGSPGHLGSRRGRVLDLLATTGGDEAKSQEGGAIGADKAAASGEKRAETRDQRRRNKDGSIKRKSTQGGTPK